MHGTDPDHPEFWGWAEDFDQRIVEIPILALGVSLAPKELWTPLSETARRRITAWIERVNAVQPVDNNWLFFRVLANAGLRRIGGKWSAEILEADLKRIDQFHLGSGWYKDGECGHCDYYGPMALHFYGLIYARLAKDVDPARAAILQERACQFAKDFIHWFTADGAAIPFGRSLTYRTAQGAFWGALAYADVEAFPWGVVKGLYLRHLRWWMHQPIFSDSGLLTIGYQYPNLIMGEKYNAPGSPYWAFKIFLPLALPATHPFWDASESALPARMSIVTMPAAKQVLMADPKANHLIALNAGQVVAGAPRHAAQKYAKFAYSTKFAFSVSTGRDSLPEGGFDSMLTLSDDGTRFRERDHCFKTRAEANVVSSCWRPWPDVEVQTWLIAADSLHFRVHRLKTRRKLWSAETGFAVGYATPLELEIDATRPGMILVWSPLGGSGLRDLATKRSGESITLEPNSNLANPLAAMPALRAVHLPGVEWLVCAVGGWLPSSGRFARRSRAFAAIIRKQTLTIMDGRKTIWRIETQRQEFTPIRATIKSTR